MSCPAPPKRVSAELAALAAGESEPPQKRTRRSTDIQIKTEQSPEPSPSASSQPTRRSTRIKVEPLKQEAGIKQPSSPPPQPSVVRTKIKREGGGVAKVVTVKPEVKAEAVKREGSVKGKKNPTAVVREQGTNCAD